MAGLDVALADPSRPFFLDWQVPPEDHPPMLAVCRGLLAPGGPLRIDPQASALDILRAVEVADAAAEQQLNAFVDAVLRPGGGPSSTSPGS